MPDDQPQAPQSFDEMEKLLLAADSQPAEDTATTQPDADRGSTREGGKDDKKGKEEPAPTDKPKTDPKEPNQDTAPDKKAKGSKDTERLDRNWKKLEEEKTRLNAEREAYKAERETWEKERLAKQSEPKNEPPKITKQMVQDLAARKRTEADQLRANGHFAKAEAAEQLAKDAEEEAARMSDTPAPKTEPKKAEYGTPEYQQAVAPIVQEIVTQRPDLAGLNDPTSPISRATHAALKTLPHFQRDPEAFASAVAVGEVILDRNQAHEKLKNLQGEFEKVKARNAELESKLAGAAPGGSAATVPGPKDLSKMSTQDAWDHMERQITG